MSPVLPLDPSVIYESKVCLVDQRRRLQRVVATFARHVPTGDAAQLLINQRHQLRQRGLVAVAPVDEQLAHGLGGACFHHWDTGRWKGLYHSPGQAFASPPQSPGRGIARTSQTTSVSNAGQVSLRASRECRPAPPFIGIAPSPPSDSVIPISRNSCLIE
jgi:hypothetical protein